MSNFDEYLRQGEPNKAEKAKLWKTAIGLQEVDGLKPSDYLITTAKQNIEGEISIAEVQYKIDSYYQQNPIPPTENRTEEADKVAARIAEILSEQTFTFSPVEYLNIHQRLFKEIYADAGKYRQYNISKKEWVLDGETVLYASADNLQKTLEYDFEKEKNFSYKGLNQQEIIEHLAHFIAYLWQIHIFTEGNTRATAIFLIKYLRKLGFRTVNNALFEQHSWYFRNALVRANYENLSKGIHKTQTFLVKFLTYLLAKEPLSDDKHLLKNRTMHVHFDTLNSADDTVNDTLNDTVKNTSNEPVLLLIAQNKHITAQTISQQLHISLSTAKRRLKTLKDQGKIKRFGSDKSGYWQILD